MDKIKSLIKDIDGLLGAGEEATRKLKATLYFYDQQIKQYATVIKNSPMGVIIYDKEGFIKYLNPKFEEQSEYSKDELLGKNIDLICKNPWCSEAHKTLFKSKEKEPIWRGFLTRVNRENQIYKVRSTLSAIKHEDTNECHFVSLEETIKHG
ncbi:MAG: PAS domain S-box protein [Candidatus Hodarchaeales archaeon]|jgi:PAS domain S-box-containing protein